LHHATNDPDSVGLCMGGGGPFGIAFHLGVTTALIDGGVPLDKAPMMGLSAGSFAAAALATGTPLSRIATVWRQLEAARPRHTRATAIDVTAPMFGHAWDRRVCGVSMLLPRPRRVLLSGARHSLADIVAASSSPWGVSRGHSIGNRLHYDAGSVSNTAADLAPAAGRLLVLAPFSQPSLGVQGHYWEARLQREVLLWRLRHQGRVEVLRPSAGVVAAGGRTVRQAMNIAHIEDTFNEAYTQGQRLLGRLGDDLHQDLHRDLQAA
jgi:predicted acylesterase/phospholipase RssA